MVVEQLAPATHITTTADLRELVADLRLEPILAVDTESNNMYAYRGQVCLVQLSTLTQDYIIDPLQIDDMQPLGELLADDRIEKIFHAARYDLICLKRDYDFEVHNLFDTMFAARLCGVTSFGLADLLHDFLGVEVDKSHQLDDWGKRPLAADSLHYAQRDTHYLPLLRDILLRKLIKLDRLTEAHEVFDDVLRFEVRDRSFNPNGFWKLGRPKELNKRQMACLHELYILRDELAQHEDVPDHKIFTNKELVSLAKTQPRNHTELFRTKLIPPRQARVYGELVLDAIDAGRNLKTLPPPPPRNLPDPQVAERYTVLHSWRKERAFSRDLDSNLIVAKDTLWELAEHMPRNHDELATITGIGTWRLEHYGDELLALLQTLR